MQGISHASCGITTQTAYSDEQVTPIAAASDAGSTFLLWEREAHYNGSRDAKPHTEKICGVSYMKKDDAGKATVIATFRQPSQVRAPSGTESSGTWVQQHLWASIWDLLLLEPRRNEPNAPN